MSKYDDEFAAQLDFLRADHDRISEELEQTLKDAQKLVALLVENNIPIPADLIERYVRKATAEELPFD